MLHSNTDIQEYLKTPEGKKFKAECEAKQKELCEENAQNLDHCEYDDNQEDITTDTHDTYFSGVFKSLNIKSSYQRKKMKICSKHVLDF